MLTLAIAPAALGLGNQVQDVDPAQYADVARRMLESGDWLHLRDQNGPFYNKPPLTMWLQAAGMVVFGVDAFAARLPGLLFGVVAMLATFFIGRALGGERRGLTAAALTGAALSTHLMVLDPKVDTALTATTALAIALMLEGRRRPWLRPAAWVVAGLAVLSKGPIGLAIPVLALLPEVVRPTWSEAPSTLARRLWSVWPFGVVLAALVALPFYAATFDATGDQGVLYMLWYQGFGRLFGQSGFLDDTTPLFFTHTALWAFLPFSPLLVWALGKRLVAFVRARQLPGDPARIPLWWFALVFVVISVSTYKLPQYLYPLTPPAALLVAEALEGLEAAVAARWARWLLLLPALGLVGGALFFALSFPAGLPTVALWGAVLAAPLVGLTVWGRRLEGEDRLVATLALGTSGLLAFIAGAVQPALLELQPSKAIGALVRAVDPASPVLPVVFTPPSGSYSFYARRDATYLMPDGLKAVLEAGKARVAVVGPDGPLEALTSEGIAFEELASFQSYPTSRPSPKFLLARTRPETLATVRLLRVWLGERPAGPAEPR